MLVFTLIYLYVYIKLAEFICLDLLSSYESRPVCLGAYLQRKERRLWLFGGEIVTEFCGCFKVSSTIEVPFRRWFNPS